MAELSMFVMERELAALLRDFAERHKLGAFSFVANEYQPLEAADFEAVLTAKKKPTTLYLYPQDHPPARKPTDKTARPREWGWISVDPGRIATKAGEKVLMMTTAQAEDRQGLPFRPANWLRQWKKRLAGELSFGVEGINQVTGGRSTYKDIAWSPEALALFESGVVWKQHPDYKVVFEPVK
jgi:hypothetical protein